MTKKAKKLPADELITEHSDLSILSEVVEFEELTEEEEQERLRLERQVERSFYTAGNALKLLRDQRLYRDKWRSFQEYCRERFGYLNRRHPYRLIEAATVVDNLFDKCDQIGHTSLPLMPASESQVRPLTKLEPDEQVEAWHKAVSEAGGKVPPARIVKDVVQRIRERHPLPNPWRVGDVCAIVVKENLELRGYGGCWAIVAEVHQFSCTVQMWDGEHQVRLENLKELAYTSQQQQEVRKLCERLSRIELEGLEKPVKSFLAELGKLDRPWLTALEETILQAIEKEL